MRHTLRSALVALILLTVILSTASVALDASQSFMHVTQLAAGSVLPNGLTDPGAP
ncbi:hypothetical protein [Sulfobacillus thermosulfidooxidans]|uniref:hypothetical protein n=1 Tax=Sulfobacillus thermosulfidooxidans TaxID=28034 RepID=UPI000A4B63AB|nr:hypothetical protein [Sulfobacillus thermosulfidooxidans]